MTVKFLKENYQNKLSEFKENYQKMIKELKKNIKILRDLGALTKEELDNQNK